MYKCLRIKLLSMLKFKKKKKQNLNTFVTKQIQMAMSTLSESLCILLCSCWSIGLAGVKKWMKKYNLMPRRL